MLGNWSTTAACTSPRHTEREIQSKGRRPATRLAAPVLTSTGRTQQRHQEHNHQRQDLHIHFCTPLWLSASHSLIYCSGVCVWMGGSERERESSWASKRERETVCSPVCVWEKWVCQFVGMRVRACGGSLTVPVYLSKYVFVYQRVTAPLQDWRRVSIWALPRRCVNVNLFFSSVKETATWVQRSCECAESQPAGLPVGVPLCVSVCVCVSLLFALDKETSWSCGLCIIDSVGHGKAPLAPSSPAISTPFPQTCKCTRLMKEKERERKGKEEREEQGGEGCVVGGTCRFMIIPKQMLLLKSLWIAKRAACQESTNQNTSL